MPGTKCAMFNNDVQKACTRVLSTELQVVRLNLLRSSFHKALLESGMAGWASLQMSIKHSQQATGLDLGPFPIGMVSQKALTGKSIKGGTTHASHLAGFNLHESITYPRSGKTRPRRLVRITATNISRLTLSSPLVLHQQALKLSVSTTQLSLDGHSDILW